MKSRKDLMICGFDVQRSGRSFGGQLDSMIVKYEIENPGKFLQIEKKFSDMLSVFDKDSLDSDDLDSQSKLITLYSALFQNLRNNLQASP